VHNFKAITFVKAGFSPLRTRDYPSVQFDREAIDLETQPL
jgi:hypothetical protein